MSIQSAIDAAVHPVEPPANPGDLPYPTHEGVLVLGPIRLRVYVLNTGQRIIHEDDMREFLEGLT